MHSDFAGKEAVSVLAIDAEGRRFDARFFAGLIVVEYRLETLALRPPQVHAHEHLGPVLRLRTSGAGMDRDDGISGVVLAGKQGLGLEPVDTLAQRVNFAPQVSLNVLPFAGQVEVG